MAALPTNPPIVSTNENSPSVLTGGKNSTERQVNNASGSDRFQGSEDLEFAQLNPKHSNPDHEMEINDLRRLIEDALDDLENAQESVDLAKRKLVRARRKAHDVLVPSVFPSIAYLE